MLFNVFCPLTLQMSCDRNGFTARQCPNARPPQRTMKIFDDVYAKVVVAVLCAWMAEAFHFHLCGGQRILISLYGLIQIPLPVHHSFHFNK